MDGAKCHGYSAASIPFFRFAASFPLQHRLQELSGITPLRLDNILRRAGRDPEVKPEGGLSRRRLFSCAGCVDLPACRFRGRGVHAPRRHHVEIARSGFAVALVQDLAHHIADDFRHVAL
jgi:hypothetical protein